MEHCTVSIHLPDTQEHQDRESAEQKEVVQESRYTVVCSNYQELLLFLPNTLNIKQKLDLDVKRCCISQTPALTDSVADIVIILISQVIYYYHFNFWG